MPKLNSSLKWHGGDYYQAPWKIEHFPEHRHYVSTCFGGGSIEFSKPPELIFDHSEVVNDINGDLMCFWHCLQRDCLFDEFKRRVEAVPFSKISFENAKEFLSTLKSKFPDGKIPLIIDTVNRAVAFFILNRQSRQGLMKDFATMSRSRTRRGMNEQASSWLTAIDGLDEVHFRLKRIVIYNECIFDLIRAEDSQWTFFYIDPPYWPDTRVAKKAYQHEMSQRGHLILLAMLSETDLEPLFDKIKKHWKSYTGDETLEEFEEAAKFQLKGKFMLCGYFNPIYELFALAQSWRLERKDYKNSSSSKKKKETKTECIWMNYQAIKSGS